MTIRVCTWLVAGVVLATSAASADPNPRTEAQELFRTMEGNARRVQAALQTARNGHARAEQLRCLDGALSRADAAVRIGREQVRLALVALDSNDLVGARRQLRLLSAQREASRGAMTDADACLGNAQVTLASDQTVVRVVVDPSIPADGAVFSQQ